MATAILKPFSTLVQASTICCPGRHVFKNSDVINFYYSYAFNLRASDRPDAVGALKDIAYTQRELIDEQILKDMCNFFLEHASRPIINHAIRSMFWCFGVHLRNLKVDDENDYILLLSNTEAAREILNKRDRRDDVQRAALIVLLTNQKLLGTADVYLQNEHDERMWILALHGDIAYSLLRAAPADIRDNEKVMLASLNFSGYTGSGFHLASARIRDNRAIVIKAVTKRGRLLEFASERLRDDFEVAKMAVTSEGYAIKYASKRLQDDRELAFLAVQDQVSVTYRFLSLRLRDDEELALWALQNGEEDALEFVSERLRDTKSVVFAAIRLNGLNLAFASDRFSDDYEAVMLAILHSRGHALQSASIRLKDEYRIVRKAFELDRRTLRFASERLQSLLRVEA